MSSKLNSGTVDLTSEGRGVRDYSNIRLRSPTLAATYLHTGFARYCIGALGDVNPEAAFQLGLGTLLNFNAGGNTENNKPWSNISLVYSNYSGGTISYDKATTAIGGATVDDNDWKTSGPAFSEFFNGVNKITPGQFWTWGTYRPESLAKNEPNRWSDVSGFDGKFGNYAASQSSQTSSTNHYTRGSSYRSIDYNVIDNRFSTDFTWFSVAGGDRDEDSLGVPNVTTYTSGLSAGGIGQNNDPTSSTGLFAALNIKLRGFKKGIDTTNANIIRTDMVL
jgi:hypothetical protein